ncbi:hypothetical protein, partial [Klebsiella pneumoniae]
AGMVTRDRLKCWQRVSGAFFGIMVGSGAPGTRFSQSLLKTQERVKTHAGAILVCLCCCVLPLLPDRAHSHEFLFFRSGSVFCLSESMKKIRFSSLWLAIPA